MHVNNTHLPIQNVHNLDIPRSTWNKHHTNGIYFTQTYRNIHAFSFI